MKTKSSSLSKKSSSTIRIKSYFNDICKNIVNAFLIIMFSIFPLFTYNDYSNILSVKYNFFKFFLLLTFILIIFITICYYLTLIKTTQNIKPELSIFKALSISDIFMLIYIIGMIISTILTKYKEESFFGTVGRLNGLEAQLLYFIMYILITRFAYIKKYLFNLLIISFVLVSLWGITDFYDMDLFGFLRNIPEGTRHIFVSSIGNLDTYVGFLGMAVALTFSLFIIEKNVFKSFIYGICSFICLFALELGITDNGVISVLSFFAFAPLLIIENYAQFIKYILCIGILSIGIIFCKLARMIMPMKWYWSDATIFYEIAKTNLPKYLLIFTFVFLTMIIILKNNIFCRFKNRFDYKLIIKKLKTICLVMVIIVPALVLILIIDYNYFHILPVKFDLFVNMMNYIKFDDEWGNYRGLNWKIALTNFINFSPLKKIFGHGPDTYYIVTRNSFFDEMIAKINAIFDSAHNEYLNILVCNGIVGIIGYIGFIFSSIIIGIKKVRNNQLYGVIALVVIAYITQAFVNIAVPITYPIFLIFLYLLSVK